MNSTLDLGYTTSFTKQYWCHICKKEFSKIFIDNVEVQCRFCGHNFCEEITDVNSSNSEHPSHFEPYESNRGPGNGTNNNSNGNSRAFSILNMIYAPRVRPRTTSSFLDMVVNILGMNNQDEGNMEQIINYIMANDTNRYGNPPASKKVVEELEKVCINDENLTSIKLSTGELSCSVCKDEFEVKQNLITLPCKHNFHDECILPWLKERNSCPTCRYELPTDDKDYEARKNSM